MALYLNADQRIFLIKYNFSMGRQVICEQKDLAVTLRENRTDRGIQHIKEFDSVKQAFKTVSKKQLKLYFDWDTEAMDELKKNNLL